MKKSFCGTQNASENRSVGGSKTMKDKLSLIWKHLKPENLQKMWLQSKWIWQYGKRYWKSMVVYTLLGIAGSGVSLVSSFISKDLIDIITGHQTGKLLSTFAAMIGFSIANILFSQASTYASTFINLKVDSEIKNDIFAKMLVTDWESLTDYHTGDLVTRWSSDASNISSGILNWIPNLVIYIFRFISALSVVLYYDPTFALFALIGIPFSAILSKPLLRRMSNNNAKSAAMNAKMYGFNQETFSNIQTIKAFDLIHFYIERLKSLQKKRIYPDANGFSANVHADFHPDDADRFCRILQPLRLGNLPRLEQCHYIRNNDHVPLPVRDSDKLCQFACRPCSVCSFPDDLCRPSDGYCGNAAGGLQP